MDTGDIVGFEAQGYHFSHKTRDIPTPKVSQEQAKASLNQNLNIINSGMAIIPTDVKTEVLVYEFKGQVDGKEFIVYINAETGKEEDILIVLNTPNGMLTI
jgi:germination protein YpeB